MQTNIKILSFAYFYTAPVCLLFIYESRTLKASGDKWFWNRIFETWKKYCLYDHWLPPPQDDPFDDLAMSGGEKWGIVGSMYHKALNLIYIVTFMQILVSYGYFVLLWLYFAKFEFFPKLSLWPPK